MPTKKASSYQVMGDKKPSKKKKSKKKTFGSQMSKVRKMMSSY